MAEGWKTTHRITLEPGGRTLEAKGGESLYEALVHAGILIKAPCGGAGRCGKCRVQIHAALADGGSREGRDADRRRMPEPGRAGQWALACQTMVNADMRVTLPPSSLAPVEAMGKSDVGALLAAHDDPPPQDVVDAPCGLAVDLGTTTIGVYLCDRGRRSVLAAMALRNPQSILGLDVISRIAAVGRRAENRPRMTALAIRAVDAAAGRLCREAAVAPGAVGRVVVVGNSTMLHLLHGEDPTPIGRSPFSPVFTQSRNRSAADLGLAFNPGARVFTPPLVSGFLGADILAAAYAVGFEAATPGTLLIDLGTNGELLLRTERGIWATACATGPAFEGGNLRFGMQALPGAVDRVAIQPDGTVAYTVIADGDGVRPKAVGLSGAGYLSAAAAMLRSGVLRRDGAFGREGHHPRLRTSGKGSPAFEVVPADEAACRRPIAITLKDIRALQLAKAAVAAGIEALCAAAGGARIEQVLLAGAFGNYLDLHDARTVGLLPPSGATRPIGNAAGAGAILALSDPRSASAFARLAAGITVINLAETPHFQQRFVKVLAFPKPASGDG